MIIDQTKDIHALFHFFLIELKQKAHVVRSNILTNNYQTFHQCLPFMALPKYQKVLFIVDFRQTVQCSTQGLCSKSKKLVINKKIQPIFCLFHIFHVHRQCNQGLDVCKTKGKKLMIKTGHTNIQFFSYPQHMIQVVKNHLDILR